MTPTLTARSWSYWARWLQSDDRARQVIRGALAGPEAAALERLEANVAAAGCAGAWFHLPRSPAPLQVRADLADGLLAGLEVRVPAAALARGLGAAVRLSAMQRSVLEAALGSGLPVAAKSQRRKTGAVRDEESEDMSALMERLSAEIRARGWDLSVPVPVASTSGLAREMGISRFSVEKAVKELRDATGIKVPKGMTTARAAKANGKAPPEPARVSCAACGVSRAPASPKALWAAGWYEDGGQWYHAGCGPRSAPLMRNDPPHAPAEPEQGQFAAMRDAEPERPLTTCVECGYVSAVAPEHLRSLSWREGPDGWRCALHFLAPIAAPAARGEDLDRAGYGDPVKPLERAADDLTRENAAPRIEEQPDPRVLPAPANADLPPVVPPVGARLLCHGCGRETEAIALVWVAGAGNLCPECRTSPTTRTERFEPQAGELPPEALTDSDRRTALLLAAGEQLEEDESEMPLEKWAAVLALAAKLAGEAVRG